ncbi:MAG TPA: hypothetical protein VF384_06995 [Planctomycetota bacterium]
MSELPMPRTASIVLGLLLSGCAANRAARESDSPQTYTYTVSDQGKVRSRFAMRRQMLLDGGFEVHFEDLDHPPGGVVSTYDAAGRPVRSLERFGDRTTTVEYGASEARIDAGGKHAVVLASPDELVDPTALWFWKVQPAPGTTVVVTRVAKNIGKKAQTRRTFEGIQTIDVLGQPSECFLVRVQPVGSDDTHDREWYDRSGMLVHKEHRTTLTTYVTELTGRERSGRP